MGISEDIPGNNISRAAGIVEQMDKRITQVENGLLDLRNQLDTHFR